MSNNKNYFQKFPIISYDNYAARNIMLRTKLLDVIKNNEIVLMPYTIQEGERADNIALAYYGDEYYAWAIYLVNDIVDPYHDWYRTDFEMTQFIEKKYGSLQAARDVIIYYRVNWANDLTDISVGEYAALPISNKKYWSPNFGYNRKPLSYRRRDVDWSLENNRLDQVVAVIPNNSNTYSVGERVYQYSNSTFLSGKGTVSAISNTVSNSTYTTQTLIMKQTNFVNNNIYAYITTPGNYFQGQQSLANGSISSQMRTDNTTALLQATANSHLTLEELVYWSPVNAEDYERELNSQKKEIKVLDRSFIQLLEDNLDGLLK